MGPDFPRRRGVPAVAIDDFDLARQADGIANGFDVDFHNRPVAIGRCENALALHRLAQICRQDGRDLGQRFIRRLRQNDIGIADYPAQAQHQRIDFLIVEGEGRQEEPFAQNISHARFAFDSRTFGNESGDVAIERALGHAEFLRKRVSGHRPPVTAECLHQVEKARGAGHDIPSLAVFAIRRCRYRLLTGT